MSGLQPMSGSALGPTSVFGSDSLNTPRSQAKPRETTEQRRSDILDSDKYEMVLDKSNIILLGPTGSGE